GVALAVEEIPDHESKRRDPGSASRLVEPVRDVDEASDAASPFDLLDPERHPPPYPARTLVRRKGAGSSDRRAESTAGGCWPEGCGRPGRAALRLRRHALGRMLHRRPVTCGRTTVRGQCRTAPHDAHPRSGGAKGSL